MGGRFKFWFFLLNKVIYFVCENFSQLTTAKKKRKKKKERKKKKKGKKSGKHKLSGFHIIRLKVTYVFKLIRFCYREQFLEDSISLDQI